MTEPSPSSEAVAHFPAEATSAGAARRFLAATLAAWDLEPLEEVATLLVSELVSNALLHAGTEIDVRLRRRPGRLRVDVFDLSPRLPDRKHYSPMSVTGRGLVFLAELADAWGTDPTPEGKSVWFELDEGTVPVVAHAAIGAELSLDDWQEWDDIPEAAFPEGAAPGATGTASGRRSATSRHRPLVPA